nr:integrase, catalytic region, zinc finger, CCHC-type, peptidase aspartic, catalytic [Tanacetum cinerariifolium]
TDGEAMINSIQNGDQPLPIIAQVSLAGNAQNAPPTLKDPKQMRGSEYGEQDRKAAILYEYETFKAIKGEQLLDTYLRDVSDALRYKKKAVVIASDSLALVAEKTNVSKQKEKVIVSSDSEGSGADDFICQQEQEFVKSDDKKVKKKDAEKKRDMSKVKSKKDSNKQVLLAEDQAWMESSSDSDQEINAKMVFMAQIEKVLLESDESSSSAEETIAEKRIKKANQQSKDLENQNKDFQEKYDVLLNQVNTFEEKNNDFNEQIKVLNEKNADLLAQSEVLHDQLKKKKGPSNTSNVDLSSVSHLKLNKNVKRYSRKDLLSYNNSHLGETNSAYVCNDAMNISCNSTLCDLFDENNLFIFDDESVRISPVSKMPFKKKPRDSMNVRSKSNLNTSLPRTGHKWLPKMQPLAEPVAKWFLRIIDSGCSKHMTGSRALLTNFVEKFLGTVRFGNNDFAMIAGYGDVVIGSMTIKKVYYVEGLGHNLFSFGKFFDKGLKVVEDL